MLSVLSEFPSVRVFDAAARLCDERYCWAEKNGTLLYRDANHLSLDGSRYLAEELVAMIRPESSRGRGRKEMVRRARD